MTDTADTPCVNMLQKIQRLKHALAGKNINIPMNSKYIAKSVKIGR